VFNKGWGTSRITRTMILVGLVLGLWLVTSACSCSSVIDSVRNRKVRIAAPAASPSPTIAPTATLAPTLEASAPDTASLSADEFGIPTEPNTPFSVEFTESQLNQYLAGKTFEAEGAVFRDAHVTLTASEIIATFQVTYQKMGVSTGLTVIGTPSVASGIIYLKISSVEPDESMKGFARIMAKSAIQETLKQYSKPQGIPLPIDNIEFQEIRLSAGKILIAGRTR
jgi:hypothetical protein